MHYEINVALHGKHFFATHKRSIIDKYHMLKVYKAIKDAFKESDGYSVSVTKWEEQGIKISSYSLESDLLDQYLKP